MDDATITSLLGELDAKLKQAERTANAANVQRPGAPLML